MSLLLDKLEPTILLTNTRSSIGSTIFTSTKTTVNRLYSGSLPTTLAKSFKPKAIILFRVYYK